MEKLFVLLPALMGFVTGFGQLSDRENYDQHYKLGARPKAGDAALQFVLPIVNLTENNGSDAGTYAGNLLSSGDLLTFKYYLTDANVIRAGLRIKTDNWTNSGTVADSSALTPPPIDNLTEFAQKSVSREFNLAGGMEKHFTAKNIFDVYAGGELFFGLGKDKLVSNFDFQNGGKSYETRSTNTNILGFGLMTGFNIFVAELPISVGLEYGLTGKWIFGGKTKVSREQTVGSNSVSGEWIEQSEDFDGNADARQYSSLGRRQFNMDTNNIIRLNIHIYFSSLQD
jgi:hypothetical protein